MKNKKLLCLMALFSLSTLTLAACGTKKESPAESTPAESTPSQSTPAESTPAQSTPAESTPADSTPSESTPSESTPDVQEQVNHQAPLVKQLLEGTQTREFDEEFDMMVEDFSGSMLGTTTGTAQTSGVLRILVDSENGDFPGSNDASIYKCARSGHFETYDGIGFKIRKVGEGNLKLEHLVLGLRGDDAYPVYNINLAEALNQDGEANPELTDEFQDIVVSPNLSIEDADTVYEGSTLKVLDQILGIHLMAENGVELSQLIEIAEVFVVKGADRTTIDAFDREKVNKPDTIVDWWRDSTGYIRTKGVTLNNNQEYRSPVSPADIAMGNVVLGLNGDSTGLTLQALDGEGHVLKEATFANLKDSEGNSIKAAVSGAYGNYVINLEQSGLASEGIRQLVVKSSKEVNINKFFLSDLATEQAALEYPKLDSQSVNMFDNFNRTQSGFNGDYEASASNPLVTGAGLNYALSYHNGELVSIADGMLTFDATTAVDYINFKEGKDGYNGEKYLVLSVKGEGGATLNDFRFDVGNGVTYINQMVSAAGLNLPTLGQADYPYTSADGFQWLVIDLAKSNMQPKASDGFIDFYYSGTGKLHINSVFYANEESNLALEPITDKLSVADITGYNYVGAFNPDGTNLVKLSFEADAGVTLESIRFTTEGGGEVWFKDGLVKDQDGNVIDATQEANGLEVIVDLKASGLDANGWNHIHSGGYGGQSGTFKVTVSKLVEPSKYVETALTEQLSVADITGYNYVGAFNPDGANLVKLSIEADAGVTLESIRFTTESGEVWFKDGLVKDQDGNVIDATQEANGLEVIVNLKASGLDAAGWNHIHSGGYGGQSGAFKVTVSKLEEASNEYVEVMKKVTE